MSMDGLFGEIRREGARLHPVQPAAPLCPDAETPGAPVPPLDTGNQAECLATGLYAQGWAHRHVGDGIGVTGSAHVVNRSELGPDGQHADPLEVVASLYRGHGTRAFERVQGQFCLALCDAREQRLVLATDRFSTRPIYYTEKAETLVFGTSLSRVAAQRSRVIDPQAILEYFLYTVIPAPRTPFAGVCKLPAGHLLILDSAGICVQPYWDMSYPESRNGTPETWARRLRAEIEAAVGRYARAEESLDRVGAFLSGGTDSSTVAGMLGMITGIPSKTFSIGYGEQGYDELEYARVASRWFRTVHHEWKLAPGEAFDALPAIVAYYEEPFGNASALPTYRCAQLAREHGVTVLFAGDGGDELFAGNERYGLDKVFALYDAVPRFVRRGVIEPVLSVIPDAVPVLGRARRYVRRANIRNPRRIFSYAPMVAEPLAELLTTDFFAAVAADQILAPAEAHYGRPAAGTSELNRLMYLDLRLAIADNDVVKVSGMTELAGVQVRYPFLDAALAEFSGRIPTALKLRGFQKRYIFKQALADFLPPEVLSKTKHGFGAPISVWMKTDPEWRSFIGDVLHDTRTRQRGYIKPVVLDEFWRQVEHDGESFYGDSLWPWLMFELWFREHMDQDTPAGCGAGERRW